MSRRALSCLIVSLFAASEPAFAQLLVPMTAHEAFHRLDPSDNAQNARIVTLADHGFAPGQVLLFESVGDYDNGPGVDAFSGIMAVFSASTTLLGPTLVNRVPDAIDAGPDHVTIPTCPGNLPTDIPQDFTVNPSGVDVIIPAGAIYLFLATRDCLYHDNTDPDGDFAVRITFRTISSSPSTISILSLGAPHPNPSRDQITIPCSLPAAEKVRIVIYSVDGRVIRRLLNATLPAGSRDLVWDGRDEHGARVSTGLYFARLTTAYSALERRVLILR